MYVLDANIFITSKNTHYGFDFVPAFWDWLDQGHSAGILCSIDKIKDELDAVSDDLTSWAGSRNAMFLTVDAATVPSLQQLATWTAASDYRQNAKEEFLASGDFQLIAYAHAHGHTVVTHELSEPAARRRVKIPDACIAMGVPYTNVFTMLRGEGAQFVLAP